MLITQRQAILKLRRDGGLNLKTASEAVKKLPKVADGQRNKVRIGHITDIISELSKCPVIESTIKFRPEILKQLEKVNGGIFNVS